MRRIIDWITSLFGGPKTWCVTIIKSRLFDPEGARPMAAPMDATFIWEHVLADGLTKRQAEAMARKLRQQAEDTPEGIG